MSASARFAVGLDLGGTNARAAAVDERGRILSSSKVLLGERSLAGALGSLAACVSGTLKALGRDMGDCAGVGLGFAGQIDAANGRVLVAPNLGWRDVDVAGPLASLLGLPVRLGNDLAVAALGEATSGAARGFPDAVLVFVGSGVGSGLILGGRIHHGARGLAGELGHTKVLPGGRLCGCGERGCLEAYAGGVNLGKRAAELMSEGRESSLVFPAGMHPTMSMIERAAEEGDALCRELRSGAAELVGVAAANVVTLLNPGALLLGGGVLMGSPWMRARVEEVVRANAAQAALERCMIVDPALGDDAGVIGGAMLAFGAGR
ncbi:MAG: Glucokinase [Pseudomonadota bacterium]|jgi:glucokinase